MPEIQNDPATASASKNIKSLTGIRGVAAIWVLMFHIQGTAHKEGFLSSHGSNLIWNGWVGVDLFFLLSGFMLAHRHARDFAKITLAGLWDFAVARFFRVYPLSFLVLCLILLLVVADPGFANAFRNTDRGNLSAASFFTTAALATRWFRSPGNWNEPIWSLSVELVGYAAFPFLMFGAARILRSTLAAVGVAGAAITMVIVLQAWVNRLGANDLALIGTLVRMAGYFSAGICLRQAAVLLKRPFPNWIVATISVSAVLAVWLLVGVPKGGGFMPAPLAVLVLTLFFQRGPVNWLLSTRIAVFLGEVSFPLYLLHVMPLLALTYHARISKWSGVEYALGVILLVAALTALAWVLHRWVERPIHEFARGLGRRHASSKAKVVEQSVMEHAS